MRLLPTALLFFSMLFSLNGQARMYSTPILSEAEEMVVTAPEQALEITERYLEQRRLSKATNRPHSNNETDRSIRTPLNTVHAYLIIGKAQSTLGDHNAAWEALATARSMVEKNSLKLAELELLFTEASVLYYLDEDKQAAKKALETVISEIGKRDPKRANTIANLTFEALLLNAIITSETNHSAETIAQFDAVKNELGDTPELKQKTRYQIALGNYFLNEKSYERALSELLSAYWLASENDFAIQIASANVSLTKLYQQQGVLDKALQHANQAAEFYENFDLVRGLSEAQTLLADIYSQQGRYNFALVHYFNALDIEQLLDRTKNIASINVSIASTYLKLLRYKQAEEYVANAIEIAEKAVLTRPLTKAYILQGELAVITQMPDVAIDALKKAFGGAEVLRDRTLMLECLSRLSRAYEQKGEYQKALEIQRRYDQISRRSENRRQILEAESFIERQRVIERQLQLDDIERRQGENVSSLVEQKKINLFLLGSLSVILLVLILRHRAANQRLGELQDLRKALYTHPRSGLRNLRMLNDRLSNSLAKTSANFEQWYLGEMIHEPLSDKLSFAMFEVPFLKVVYLQHGYHQGLELERELGDYLVSQISDPARVYHFSDAMFIYIEPDSVTLNDPDKMAKRIQSMVNDFVVHAKLDDVDDRLRIGMADYPFLPRAFTSINDKELIDILLMATSAARQACKAEQTSQWVHLSAIESTPAACFANTNVRKACFDAIGSGLIKVKTSASEGINWQTLHESDKN
ncbi:hypothetical protein A1OW_10100 [Enterovibrio norvegicus]|uniref:GGDEF domain-containing protein n=1 Tax=Enterovibrio norvegicus TaxID=188144 RepID=UPI00037ED9A5|nr:GGDEF domain-containing protein [Enterovibrio norvegicus]OEF51254.1 hypothetical protein A1OW_10100 [Enterovibrio norvegicus]